MAISLPKPTGLLDLGILCSGPYGLHFLSEPWAWNVKRGALYFGPVVEAMETECRKQKQHL